MLECEGGKYYVGRTDDPERRMQEHSEGFGSAWTTKYSPIKMIEVIENADKYDEDKYVKKYMEKYGIDNVRGGSYAQVKLPNETRKFLDREIVGADDRCFRCHKPGHFVNDCLEECDVDGNKLSNKEDEYIKSMIGYSGVICFRCGRKGHKHPVCKAKYHVEDDRDVETDNNTCYRCGRLGHWLITCGETEDRFGRKFKQSKWWDVLDSVVDSFVQGGGNNYNTKGKCYRCGRYGHYANECYAKTDANGRKL